MPREEYPETVTEVLDPQMQFRPEALRAVRAFAKARPWRGNLDERKEKFRQLNRQLSAAYGMREPKLNFESLDGGHSGASCYSPVDHQITLRGRLSVVTMLHEFGHARGMGERKACRWSVNLFRRCFPKQYSRLLHVGHTLIRPSELARLSRAGAS